MGERPDCAGLPKPNGAVYVLGSLQLGIGVAMPVAIAAPDNWDRQNGRGLMLVRNFLHRL